MKLTRTDIIRMGRAANPWAFIPVGVRALEVAPQDRDVRYLLAANFAHLGLRTPAREFVATLPNETERAVVDLRTSLDEMPDDLVSPESLARTASTNLEALQSSNPRAASDLREHFAAWLRSLDGAAHYRTRDKQIVRRDLGRTGIAAWPGFGDQMTMARAVLAQHMGKCGPFERAFVIEGLSPPWFFVETMRRTPPNRVGYQPRVTLVQADPLEFLSGLAVTDLADQLSEGRIEVFIGEGASREVYEAFRARPGVQAGVVAIATPGTRKRTAPPLGEVLAQCARGQEADHHNLVTQIAERSRGQRARDWLARYDAAAHGEPLRIVIPTTRYSTYVAHASHGLGEAFRRLGHEVEIIEEPDPWSVTASTGVLEPIARTKPDLGVLINYTRAAPYTGLFPDSMPFVTWVQDAMPHLFDTTLGPKLGERDFVVGHLHEATVSALGLPDRRRLSMPVVADDARFHAGEIEPALARELACEVMAVTHHSETPEAQRDRMCQEATGRTGREAVNRLHERISEALRSPVARPAKLAKQLAVEVVSELWGSGATPEAHATVRHQVAMPMIDRALRHRTLRVAAELCVRRGWRFRLFGNGWGTHPTLGRFAHGPIDHGEPLRAAYRSSAVTLHVCAGGLVHQRVLECALSGGLPACAVSVESFAPLLARARAELAAAGARAIGEDQFGELYALATPLARDWANGVEALGEDRPAFVRMPHRIADPGISAPPEEEDPTWVLGDLVGGNGLGFVDERSLERLVIRASNDPAWRNARGAEIAARVRERLTTTVLAQRMIRLVHEELRLQAGTIRAAA